MENYNKDNFFKNKELVIDLMLNYKEKKFKKGKCFWKYFWNGFQTGLVFTFKPTEKKYCPHCCVEISKKEYFEGYIFIYGCEKCRERKDEK